MKAWFALLGLLAAVPLWAQDSSPAPEMNAAEKQFQEAFSNVTLVGHYTSGEGADLKEDRYVIEKVAKVKDDIWNFTVRIQYNKKDVKVTMPLPVKWAGDTPVISLTNYAVPGFGSFSARVVIYDGGYAGTWGSTTHGGKMFGKIVKNDAKPDAAPPR